MNCFWTISKYEFDTIKGKYVRTITRNCISIHEVNDIIDAREKECTNAGIRTWRPSSIELYEYDGERVQSYWDLQMY